MASDLKIVKQTQDGTWVVKEKGLVFWKTISKPFKEKHEARDYAIDLKALYAIEKLFKGEHMI